MKAIQAKMNGGLTTESRIKVEDNSGAKELRIIAREGYRGRRRRRPAIGVGDIFIGSVVKGKVQMRKKKVRAVVIRQKKEYRRSSGERIKFEDNAAVLVTEKNEPLGTEIKGVISRDVAERFPRIATIAKNVV